MANYGDIKLDGKVAVITGGASGMGRETAIALASVGAKVAVGDIHTDGLESLRSELGDNCVTQPTDITNEDQVEDLVALAVKSFGGVDIGVNCAGAGGRGPLLEIEVSHWRKTVDINLNGMFVCIKHQGRQMRDQGRGGVIVNLTSVTARLAAIGATPYAAAKAGANHMIRIAAEEFRDIGIRVLGLSPGYVDTPMTAALVVNEEKHAEMLECIPCQRVGEVVDIAHTIVFLVSENADFINGEVIHVDGGQRAHGTIPDYVGVRAYYRGEACEWNRTS